MQVTFESEGRLAVIGCETTLSDTADELTLSLASQPDLPSGAFVRVALLCDFFMDATGRAVDGGFVGGTLPSGSGSEGGRFESWFRIGEDLDDE